MREQPNIFEKQPEALDDDCRILCETLDIIGPKAVSAEELSGLFKEKEEVGAIINFGHISISKLRKKIEEFFSISEDYETEKADAISELLTNAYIHSEKGKNVFGFKCFKKDGKWKMYVANFSKKDIPKEILDIIEKTKSLKKDEVIQFCQETLLNITTNNNLEPEKELGENEHGREMKDLKKCEHGMGLLIACETCKVECNPIIKDGEKIGYNFSLELRE